MTLLILLEASIAGLIASPSSTLMLAVIQAAADTGLDADALAALVPDGQDDLQGTEAVEALEALRTAAGATAHDQHRGWRAVEGSLSDAVSALDQTWAHCPDPEVRAALETHVAALSRLRVLARARSRQASDMADLMGAA